MPSRTSHVGGLLKAAGALKTIEILVRRGLRMRGIVSVSVGGQRVGVRPENSDLFVLSQVFGSEEYRISPDYLVALRRTAAAWQAEGIKPVVVDAGANIGYSALYFAALFPGACVLAVEPDETSFKLLVLHTRANPDIRPVYAALWSHERGLELRTRPEGAWGSRMAEGAGTPSRRLDELVASVPNGRLLILKLDIEGAEREVVASCPDLVAEAKCILVEPHDFMSPGSNCLAPLYKIAAGRKFDTILSGENLLLFATEP